MSSEKDTLRFRGSKPIEKEKVNGNDLQYKSHPEVEESEPFLFLEKKEGNESEENEPGSVKGLALVIILTALSFFTRLYKIGWSNKVVWDEAHFGKFGAYYIVHYFYHDVHPPLGKMLVGLGGYISGSNGTFKFDSGHQFPNDLNYTFQRSFHALFGIIMVPLAYGTARNMGMSRKAAFLSAAMVLFDNALCVISRFILLDSMVLGFCALSFYFVTGLHANRKRPFSLIWFYWLIGTGVSLGLASSVKWIGFFAVALVGYYTIEDLYDKFGDNKISTTSYIGHWIARIFGLIIVPVLIYSASFYVHFKLLSGSGDGDSNMPSLFQAGLDGSPIGKGPIEVAYGSKVTIKSYSFGGALLHSHASLYPEGSKQHQITTYAHSDSNNDWVFLRDHFTSKVRREKKKPDEPKKKDTDEIKGNENVKSDSKLEDNKKPVEEAKQAKRLRRRNDDYESPDNVKEQAEPKVPDEPKLDIQKKAKESNKQDQEEELDDKLPEHSKKAFKEDNESVVENEDNIAEPPKQKKVLADSTNQGEESYDSGKDTSSPYVEPKVKEDDSEKEPIGLELTENDKKTEKQQELNKDQQDKKEDLKEGEKEEAKVEKEEEAKVEKEEEEKKEGEEEPKKQEYVNDYLDADEDLEEEPQILRDGDVIRLNHITTGANLHSHNVAAHVSKKDLEASGYMTRDSGDTNDHWIIEIYDDIIGHKDGKLRILSTRFKLRHNNTGCYLISTGNRYPDWGFNQGEVACKRKPNSKDNILWNIEGHWNKRLNEPEEGTKLRSPFLKNLLHINVAMWNTNNALTPDEDKLDALTSQPYHWPLMLKGIRMCGWGDDDIKFYMLGNPLVWWSSTLALVLVLAFNLFYIIRFKRRFREWYRDEWEHFTYSSKMIVLGWFFQYIPYYIMGRVMYVHHYFPALYFAIFALPFILDHITKRSSPQVQLIVFSSVTIAITIVFIYFKDMTFGMDYPSALYKSRNWLPTWKLVD